MSLIVSTSHSILTLNSGSDQAQVRRRGEGLYYGISRSEHGDLLVAARGRLVSDAAPMEGETGRILSLDDGWHAGKVWRAPFALRDMHEIAWSHGALWVTCCLDDLVAIRDASGRWQCWWPLGEPTVGAEPDRYHFNSLFFEGDLVWVLAHQRGPSRLLAFPVEAALSSRTVAPTRVVNLGVQAHNIWRMEGGLSTCSSAEGCLVSEDGWRLKVGGFPRGVARVQGGWAVGVSELAERHKRDLTTGRVVFFDEEWRELGRVELAGEGLVLDLMGE